MEKIGSKLGRLERHQSTEMLLQEEGVPACETRITWIL